MGRPADSSAKSRRRQMVKRGPWTTNEDTILAEYVKKHGQGNWNAVQKNSGLIGRCGKSCRLRWSNHLRPDLKKGAFTSNEEKLIIQLHANLGNKWARIASQLPGRTDNEIKNYWNTRLKRRQRAGLPIYPQIISMQQQEHHHPAFTSQVPLISPLQNKSLSSNQLFSESSFECSKSGLLGDLLGGSASDHALAKTDYKAFGFGHRIHVNANANSYNHVYEQGVNSTEASEEGSSAIMDDDLMNLLNKFPLSVPIPDWYDEVQHGHGSESSRFTTNGGATQSQPNPPVANSTGPANQEYWNFGSRVWNNMFLMLN